VASEQELRLHVTLHFDELYIVFAWLRPGVSRPTMSVWVRLRDENCLEWTTRGDAWTKWRATKSEFRFTLTAAPGRALLGGRP
jgi:hypothetical protein